MASSNLQEPVAETEKHLFCVEMMNRLNIQRENEKFYDVILEVGSGDDMARLKAHRIVLCAGSPFFNSALNSEMKEKKGVIRLEQSSQEVMEKVLEYLYTGHTDVSETVSFDLLVVADYLMILGLKDLCEQVVLRGMSLSNCMEAYNLSVKYQCEELKKGARVFILENFVALAKTEDFLSLNKEQILEWISSDEINVRGEEEMFTILRNWIVANNSQEQDFYELFRHIRFMYLPRDFFLEVIVPDPMVKNNLDCANFCLNATRMMFRGDLESFFAQAPRNCLKTHEDAIVACGARRTICYIPLTKRWYTLANTLTLRNLYGQNVSYCQGKLFFIGGNSSGFPAEFYDPSQNKWSKLKSFKKRIKFCTVSTCRGFLYVIGGVDEDENLLSSVKRYDPEKDSWQEMPSLSSPRSSVCTVSDGSFLYAVGGNTIHGFVAIAERFDPKEKTWTRISPTLEKRGGAVGAAVDEKVFVFGGLVWSGMSVSTFAEMYDPAVDKWSSIPSSAFLALRLRWLSAISFKGTIFVSGECADDTQGNGLKLHIYDSIAKEWVYCCKFPDIVDNFRISCLRIPQEILNSCEVTLGT